VRYQETDVDADGNGLAATRSVSGVQLSLDSEPYANDWQMGATLSIVSKADVESNASAVKLSGEDVSVAVRKRMSDWLFAVEADMGNYSFNADRNINIAGAVFSTNQQDVKTRTYGVGISTAYNMDHWKLSAGLRYNNVSQDAFTEAGNNLLMLTVADAE